MRSERDRRDGRADDRLILAALVLSALTVLAAAGERRGHMGPSIGGAPLAFEHRVPGPRPEDAIREMLTHD